MSAFSTVSLALGKCLACPHALCVNVHLLEYVFLCVSGFRLTLMCVIQDMVFLFQEREERRKDHDLCYNLKAWGLCLDALCSYRHVHTTSPSSFPSPQAVELPRDGSIKVCALGREKLTLSTPPINIHKQCSKY